MHDLRKLPLEGGRVVRELYLESGEEKTTTYSLQAK